MQNLRKSMKNEKSGAQITVNLTVRCNVRKTSSLALHRPVPGHTSPRPVHASAASADSAKADQPGMKQTWFKILSKFCQNFAKY